MNSHEKEQHNHNKKNRDEKEKTREAQTKEDKRKLLWVQRYFVCSNCQGDKKKEDKQNKEETTVSKDKLNDFGLEGEDQDKFLKLMGVKNVFFL